MVARRVAPLPHRLEFDTAPAAARSCMGARRPAGSFSMGAGMPAMNAPQMNGATHDLLTEWIDLARVLLADASAPTRKRVQLFWTFAATAFKNNVAASDIITADFIRLAIDAGLISESGRWVPADVRATERRHGRKDISMFSIGPRAA